MPYINRVILFLVFALSGLSSSATQCVSVASGNWKDASTWSCGAKPGCGDTITISAGDFVTVSQQEDYTTCTEPMFIIVEGTLDFSNGKKLDLPIGSGVVVESGGEITGGGGGNANVISIDGTSVWTSSTGDIVEPTVLGTPIIGDVISIASGNWSNPVTWDCTCVPDSLDNVTIDTLHSVTLDGDNTSNNFTIYGSFSASGAFSLDVARDWTNQGAFTNGLETIRFDGGVAQSITGVGTQMFSNITITANSTVTHTLTSLTLTGNLLIETGSFNTSNALILKSDASGTANIGDLTNGTFTGNVIMERMVPAGATNWRFLSSGLSGQTISGWNDDFITSGFLGSDFPAFPFTSIYSYDETVANHKDSGFVAVTSIAESLTPGKGFWVWSGDNSAGTAAFTIDLIGSINQGNVSLPVSFTNTGTILNDGWNMVGNPYPCAIDWDSPNWTKTNVDNAVYVWDPNSGAYASYVGGVGNNGGSNVIASSQAFWVKTNAAGPALTAAEGVKSTSLADPFKNFVPNQLIRIELSSIDSSTIDETTISFNPSAHQEFDGAYDAVKIKSVNSNLVSISTNSSDNQKLSINSLAIEGDFEIPVYVKVPTSGLYKFVLKDFGGVDAAACIYVRDEENFSFSLVNGDLTFIKLVTATTEPYHKLTLIVSANNKVEFTEPSCAQVDDAQLTVSNYGNGPWEYSFMEINDSVANTSTSTVSGSMTYTDLSPGTYTVSVNNNSFCPNRLSEIVIPEVDSIIASFNSDLAGIVLIDDYEFSFLNESNNADNFSWVFGDGGESVEVDPVYYFDTPGEYEITLTATKNDVCKHEITKKILVLDVPFGDDSTLSAHVFPNPAQSGESVLLHFNKTIENADITIHNIRGKVIFHQAAAINSTYTNVNIATLPMGIYIVKIIAESEAVFVKLLVE